jgi:hypothetical protein
MFRSNVSPLCSRSKSKPSKKPANKQEASRADEDDTLLRNFGEFLSNVRRYNSEDRNLHSYRSENLLTLARSE